MRILLTLDQAQIAALRKEIQGTGGWQSLLRHLQDNLVGNELIISIADIGKIVKYSTKSLS